MKKLLRIFTVFSVVASSLLFATSAHADHETRAGSVTAVSTGATTADVSFVMPSDWLTYGVTYISFTAISSPGNFQATITPAAISASRAGTISVSGLSPSTAYTFVVRVTFSGGFGSGPTNSSASNSITTTSAVSAPGAPTSVTATSTGATTANVSFTAPASNGGATITSYTATSSPGGITGSISQAGSGTIAMTGLTAGTAYTFTVTATNSAGTSVASSASNSTTTVGAPSSPTSVVATATGKRSATVSFAAPASNGGSAITSYRATSTPGGITQILTQATGGTFNFDGLQPSTAYTFAVTATNAIGTSGAATSNSVTTTPLEVASLSALSFADDGTGTAGKIVWAGMNVDRVLYTGPAQFYPGPFKYGAFTSGWNGLIRNLTPDTTYTVSINAHSADGVGGEKSLTFKTNASTNVLTDSTTSTDPNGGIVVIIGLERGFYWLSILENWLNENTFVTGEASNMYGLLKKFFLLETSVSSTTINVPTSRVSNVVATSLTPTTCSVISATAAVDAGLVTALSTDKCTISYTVTGGSNAPATIVRDFYFKTYVSLPVKFSCGDGFYTITAGVVSAGSSCTGAVTIDASATSIAFGAFQYSAISSIKIPNSVTAIPSNAFRVSSKLTKVELGNAVASIGNFAFASTSLVSISIPNSLQTIGIGAFYGSFLTSFNIPVGTTMVDSQAFAGSKTLKTIIIPSTVTDMSEYALAYSGFETVNYCGNNASVLAAIAKQPISATCVPPAIKP